MFYLIYQIRNKVNGKIYIGKHKTDNKDDDYMGSGKYLKAAQSHYGIENFEKIILFECFSEEEMNRKEAELVNQEFIDRDDTYNIILGGDGGWSYVNEHGLNAGVSFINENMLNNKVGQCYKTRELLKSDENFAKDFRKKISDGLKRHKQEHPDFRVGKNNPRFGCHLSEETKRKCSLSHKGSKNYSYGKHWYHNSLGQNKFFKEDEVPDGWTLGRIFNRGIE